MPADFSLATQRANSSDEIVAENMGPPRFTSLKPKPIQNPAQPRPGEPESWKDTQQKATNNLNIAKYKLAVARTRWGRWLINQLDPPECGGT